MPPTRRTGWGTLVVHGSAGRTSTRRLGGRNFKTQSEKHLSSTWRMMAPVKFCHKRRIKKGRSVCDMTHAGLCVLSTCFWQWHHAEPEAIIPSYATQHLGKPGKPVNLYSHGSCQHQHCPGTLIAWLLTCARVIVNGYFKQTNLMWADAWNPNCRKSKMQRRTAHRTGWDFSNCFSAWIVSWVQSFSDSAYAVNTVALTRSVNSGKVLEYHNEFDLVTRAFQTQCSQKQVLKIKAHQESRVHFRSIRMLPLSWQ